MTGDILYPLNTLKKMYPDVYAEHVRKYRDREDVMRLTMLPEKTFEHYVESYAHNKKPLPFHFAPHILYNGAISIKDVPVIEV